MEAQVRRIKAFLKSEFYTMNDIWLSDCVEYYVSNHNNPPDDEVCEFVKSQWLLSDLRKINSDNGCLPRDLSQQMCTVLPGTYILQMDKMYDIATSKYKQLQEIRNVSTANIEATEEQKPQSWEPKKKRMLQLYLTDGIQDISAIEYRPIPSINNMLLPGYKVMIVGPVTCRRGVILLEAKNFKEVGGEEESLLICNALENVLARALGLPENPDPYNDNKPTQEQANKRPQSNQDGFDDEFDIDFASIPDVVDTRQETNETVRNRNASSIPSNRSQVGNPAVPSNKNSTVRSNKKDTEFHSNDIIEVDDDVIEVINPHEFDMPSTSAGRNLSNRRNEKPKSKPKSSNYAVGDNKSNQKEKKLKVQPTVMDNTEFLDDDFYFPDFEVIPGDMEKDETTSVGQKQSSAASNAKQQNGSNNFGSIITASRDDEFPDDDFDFDDFDVLPTHTNASIHDSNAKNSASDSASNKLSNAYARAKPDSAIYEKRKPCPIEMSKLSISSSPTAKPAVSSGEAKLEGNKITVSSKQDDFPDDDFDFENFEVTPRKTESNRNEISNTVRKTVERNKTNESPLSRKIAWNSGSSGLRSSPNASTSKSKSSSPMLNYLTKSNAASAASTGNKRPAVSPPNVGVQKMPCLQETPKRTLKKPSVSKTMKISDFLEKVSPISAPPDVCDFLCDIVKDTVTEVVFKTVRAQITALGKLSKKDSCWQLEGTITDRTACLEITFASEVLERLLGFSVQEFSQKKKLKKTNPEIDHELRMVFRNAETKLKNLDALVELELKPNEKARIISTRQLTDQQKEIIDKKLKKLLM